MHLSMHNWMRAEPVSLTIRRLAKFGYHSLEISGEPERYDTSEVRQLLKDNGLFCWGSVTLMLGERNLLAKDKTQRAKSVQYVKDCLTMIKELDGTVLTVVPGTVGKVVPEASADEEWQWAVESMKEAYDHAQKEGVQIGIEPINRFETYFITRAAQAQALAEATGPDCGVILDTFHTNIEEEDRYQAFVDVKDRLLDVHIADSNRMPAGFGHWDWPKFIDMLKSIGYDGGLATEFVAPIDRTPANPYTDAEETEAIDISEEDKKFIEDHGGGLVSEQFYSWLVEQNGKTILPLIDGK